MAALPTAVTVATSIVATDVNADLLADLEAGRARDRQVGRSRRGTSSHGPVETGTNIVVMAVAGVPTLAMVRVSPSMSIFWPASKPVVLRTWMVVAPGLAGAASPELERPSK